MSAQHTLGTWHKLSRRLPPLVAEYTKNGDRVVCTDGAGTGFLRRGREYTVAHVTPTGYVRVVGSDDYYHAAGRFTSIAAIAKAPGGAA